MPVNPTNAPLAHPLAPDPHTSVGLFWIYSDPNTGRQWTGGTYKVKRCVGNGCTPTGVIASGLTNADYQDFDVLPSTTYGYRYVANDGVDSADSPTVYVTTKANVETLVSFPDSVWEELLGPQPVESQIPFSWYNATAKTAAQDMIPKFPFVVPFALSGTGSINNGSTTLNGTGTFFLEQVAANNPNCTNHILINGVDAGTIATVNSNTQITLTTPWAGTNQSNVALSTNASLCGFGDVFSDYLIGNQLYYYDSPMALWQLYFRTGDPQYMRGAIKASESVFSGFLRLGRNREVDNLPPPRNFQFSGLLLLGLAGRSDVWDWLDHYLTARYPTWISNYRGGDSDFLFMREKAYMLLFTSWFVSAAPDVFKRSDGSTTTANGSINVDGSLATGRKGHWVTQLNTDLPGFITSDQTAYGLWFESAGAGDWGEGDSIPFSVANTFQPFVGGLLGDSLGYCWNNSRLSSTARTAARTMTLKLAAALGHLTYNVNIAADEPGVRWRTIHYLFGGGHRLNPYAFQYGSDSSILNRFPDANMIAQYRQSIPLMLSTFGWAYVMSGQPWYKTMADEMANAAFASLGENTGGTGDGKRCLCDSTSNRKDYGQCYRTSGRYLGQRLLSPASIGTPPVVTMPGNVTLSNGINQAELTASVNCTNTPCTYKWGLQEYPLAVFRNTAAPTFLPDNALTTKISGLESGPYKLVFYALDSLGLEGHGTVTVTAGDGQFPPVAIIGEGNASAISVQHTFLTTNSSVNGAVRAYSPSGRTLSHSFSAKWPKDKSAPTITPSGTTGNVITFTVSGLSAGLWIIKDTITDSAGLTRTVVMYIRHTAESQPSASHNTIPDVVAQPNHILPSGSESTKLYVVPLDPEGIAGYSQSAAGYTLGYNGGAWLVTALTHSWSQISGPVSATITGGTTLVATIEGLTQPGEYVFRYSGTDQQGDTVTKDLTVTVLNTGAIICKWSTVPVCQ